MPYVSPYRFLKAKLTTIVLASLVFSPLQAAESSDMFDNLVPVENAKVGAAFIDPEADFGTYRQVILLDTFVAFKANWERDQRRQSRTARVSAADMDRIKSDVATLFNEVMVETLEANDGFPVVDAPDYDVLLLRAAIIDLDITAPDTMSAGRTTSFTATTGAATMYLELYDSVSGQIIGRAADRSVIRDSTGRVSWSNRVTNTQDARRMFRRWADLLRSFLDSHYSGAE